MLLCQFRVPEFYATSGLSQCGSILVHTSSHPCARQRRESCRLQFGPIEDTMSKSRTATLTETQPPASRQTQAAALSKANPRRPNTSTFAHAARSKDVEGTATPAGTRRGRKREPQTAKEQDAEHLGIQPAVKPPMLGVRLRPILRKPISTQANST